MPAGRPRGSKGKSNPIKAALRTELPGPGQRTRPPEEFFQGTKHVTLNMDAVSHAALSIHARRRHIPFSWLVQDVLNLWLAAATDYDQGVFRDMLPPRARAARTPERFVGYIEGLGFAPATQSPIQDVPPSLAPVYTATPTPPQQPGQAHQPFTQERPVDIPHRGGASINDLTTPYRHPMTQGPASYPHPEPGLPHNSQLFDPSVHLSPGSGSAAQDVEQGRGVQDELPPLNSDVQKMLEFYRVDPKDIR